MANKERVKSREVTLTQVPAEVATTTAYSPPPEQTLL